MQEIILTSSQPHSWLRIATVKYGANATILDSKILPHDIVEHLFEIDAKPELASAMLADIGKDKDVIQMDTADSGSGRIRGSIRTGRCTICKEIAKSKCFLASVEVDEKGAEWTVMGNDEAVREVLSDMESAGIPFKLKLKRNLKDKELLTARQEEMLLMAYMRGYFEFPRKAGLKELASETGVKTSTITEILRRGQRKIVEDYFLSRHFHHPHEAR